MTYQLKPIYYFDGGAATGIDTVPVGRIIVVENFGNSNEIKTFKKTSNANLTDSTTINQAISLGNIFSSDDTKRDISDSYSITEVDSALSTKANVSDVLSAENVYTKEETYNISELYHREELDGTFAFFNIKFQKAFVTPPTSSIGSVGDTAGQMSINSSYIFHCVLNYDGVSDIWARAPLVLSSW